MGTVSSAVLAYLGVTGISLVLTLTLGYLASQERRIAGLREVSLAYGIYTLRFVAFAYDPELREPLALFAAQALNALGSAWLILGALRMAGAANPVRLVAGLGAAGVALGAWSALSPGIEPLGTALSWAFSGGAQLVLAWTFFGLARDARVSCYSVAAAPTLAQGVLRITVPIWSSQLLLFGLTISAALYVATAVALIVALQRTQLIEARDAKRRARAEQRQAQLVFDSSTDLMALIRVEPGGRLVLEQVNASLVAFLNTAYPGRAIGPLVGREIGEVLERDCGVGAIEILEILAIYRSVLATGEPQRAVSRLGERIRELVALPLLEDGKLSHIFYRGTDITEIRRTEDELRRSNERMRTIMESAPVAIAIARRADGVLTYVNPACCEMMGAAREALQGQAPVALGMWTEAVRKARLLDPLDTARSVQFEHQFADRRGRSVHVMLSAQELEIDGETCVLAMSQDVSEMRRASEEIRRLNATLEERVTSRTAELEQALSELESITYSVSHDLRAPLRAMASFSSLLAGRQEIAAAPELAAYARRVASGAAHMGKLVDGLLRYAQLGREPIRPAPVRLGEMVRSVAAELHAQKPVRQIHWDIARLPDVRADVVLLRLVLEQFLDNAVKFTGLRPDARISVSFVETPVELEITVRDNGIGFDMAHAEKLFTPFQRLHADDEFAGTGIGLAYARRIIERHRGRIWCDATPGAGAAFSFSIPR